MSKVLLALSMVLMMGVSVAAYEQDDWGFPLAESYVPSNQTVSRGSFLAAQPFDADRFT